MHSCSAVTILGLQVNGGIALMIAVLEQMDTGFSETGDKAKWASQEDGFCVKEWPEC